MMTSARAPGEGVIFPDGFGNPWMANLEEIGLPEPVPWWPPAPGWYVVAGLLLLGLVWLARRAHRRWRANAYRRGALARLGAIERLAFAPDTRRVVLLQLPVLLKQTALAAYGRDRVASLSGQAWLSFLDGTMGDRRFTTGAGRTLLSVAYARSGPQRLTDEETERLLDVSRWWVRTHRDPPC
jgi:hypothetical protein